MVSGMAAAAAGVPYMIVGTSPGGRVAASTVGAPDCVLSGWPQCEQNRGRRPS
jgi:hypothetical protein